MTIAKYLPTLAIFIATMIVLTVLTLVLTFAPLVAQLVTHPANACHEDENWIATDYRDPEGQEWRNVTRKCTNVDDEPWTPTDNS